MITKKPFATIGLSFGQIVFKAGISAFNDEDPNFGRQVKSEHSLTEPIMGVVDGVARAEDGKHLNVVIVPIRKDNQEPLSTDADRGAEVIKLPIDLSTAQDFGENVWCDDKKRVYALCKKLNQESKAGLEGLLTAIQGKLDYLDSVNVVLEEEEA